MREYDVVSKLIAVGLALIVALYVCDTIAVQRSMLHVLFAVTPGASRSEVEQSLGKVGRGTGPVSVGHAYSMEVSKGGTVELFDSFPLTPIQRCDFVVVYDKDAKVVAYRFLNLPEGV